MNTVACCFPFLRGDTTSFRDGIEDVSDQPNTAKKDVIYLDNPSFLTSTEQSQQYIPHLKDERKIKAFQAKEKILKTGSRKRNTSSGMQTFRDTEKSDRRGFFPGKTNFEAGDMEGLSIKSHNYFKIKLNALYELNTKKQYISNELQEIDTDIQHIKDELKKLDILEQCVIQEQDAVEKVDIVGSQKLYIDKNSAILGSKKPNDNKNYKTAKLQKLCKKRTKKQEELYEIIFENNKVKTNIKLYLNSKFCPYRQLVESELSQLTDAEVKAIYSYSKNEITKMFELSIEAETTV